MLQSIQKRLDNRKGFTLIELIVVIAIIAILAAVLIPRFAGFTGSARDSAAIADAKNLATAFSAVLADDSDYTLSGDDIDPTGITQLEDFIGDIDGQLDGVNINSTDGVNFTLVPNDGGASVQVTDGQVS